MPKCCISGSCFNYHKILYIVGYGWKYRPIERFGEQNDIDYNSIQIDIKENNASISVDRNDGNNRSSRCLTFFNTIYNLVIISLIAWPIVYSLVSDIKNKENKMFRTIMFQLLFLSQYIVGSMYFSKQHLYNKIRHNENVYNYYCIAINVILLLSLVIMSTFIILLNIGYDITVYSNVYNNQVSKTNKILINILLAVESFVSYLSYFTNIITFSVIMIYHQHKINTYCNKLVENNNLAQLMNNLTEDYHHIRDEYSATIENTNILFTVLNIFGLLSLFMALKNIYNNEYYVTEIMNVMFFMIVETIYLVSINKVRGSIGEIKKKMTSISVISQVITKTLDQNIISKINVHDEDNGHIMAYHAMAASVKNTEVLDWVVLEKILNEEWETFTLLGFPITDSMILQKLFGIIITVLIANDISAFLTV
jgi:hypothetical protein